MKDAVFNGGETEDIRHAGREINLIDAELTADWVPRPGGADRPLAMHRVREGDVDGFHIRVGRPHASVELSLRDGDGEIVTGNEIGEVCLRSPAVMSGYWRDPEQTRAAFTADGFVRTGDLGWVDDRGRLRLVGRSKEMYVRGGYNVYPREIEEFLYTHPKVSDVQVIGLPDPKYGEEIMAWIKLKPGEQVTEDELKAFCKGQIAHYKIPRYIKFVDAFPMTVTGKIMKFQMREQSTKELGLDSVASIQTA